MQPLVLHTSVIAGRCQLPAIMSTQQCQNSNDRGGEAKPVPVLLCPLNMWHQLALQSSFLLQNYQVPTAQRTQFDSITKAKTSHDVYETIRSDWDNIPTHIIILGGKISIHFTFQWGRKVGPSLSLSYAGVWKKQNYSLSTRWRRGVNYTPRLLLRRKRTTGPIE